MAKPGGRRGTDLDPAAFPDVPTLARAWRADEGRMPAWLAALEDAEMGVPAADGCPRWRCLAHVVNHGTQHRSDAAMVLTHRGHSPGDLDLIFSPHAWEQRPTPGMGPLPSPDARTASNRRAPGSRSVPSGRASLRRGSAR